MNPMLWSFSLPVVGKVEFPAYMTMLIIGLALATWLARREEDRAGRNGDRIVDMALVAVVFGILGARLLSVLADGHFHDFVNLCTNPKLVPAIDAKVAVCQTDAQCGYSYLCNQETHSCYPPRDCLAALKFWQGGLAYYGGLLLAAPAGLWYAKKKQLGVARIADLCSPVIAFGLFFGRMGCFLNGCCYGKETDMPWGVDFPTVPGHAHVHPTQLYEAIGCLGIFAILYWVVRPRKRRHGDVFAALLTLYGLLRFMLEFLRDDERGAFLGISTSQWIGIPLVAWGVFWWLAKRRADHDTRPPEAALPGT
jgi:phosphatidylglycerol:prolipoprotein diacylglycerol transferase